METGPFGRTGQFVQYHVHRLMVMSPMEQRFVPEIVPTQNLNMVDLCV